MPDNLPIDIGPALSGILKGFENVYTATLGDDNPVSADIERPAGRSRIFGLTQRTLGLEAGEYSERAGGFGNSTGDSHIDFAQAEHLQPLDQRGITGGAGGAD